VPLVDVGEAILGKVGEKVIDAVAPNVVEEVKKRLKVGEEGAK
jgi:hypothetical protein